MNKKIYQKPTMKVVKMVQSEQFLNNTSGTTSVRSFKSNFVDEDDNFTFGGGGTVDAR